MAGDDTSVEPAAPNPQTANDDPAPGKRRWPRILGIVGLVMVLMVAGVAAGSLWLLNQVSGNIATVPIDTAPPPEKYEAVNILLLGSDSRTGKGNKTYGKDAGRDGERSDTTILIHISADRTRALAVSIPRDTYVEQPLCATNGVSGIYDKFNNAFEQGGASCTTDLVRKMTGVPVHHVVVVDFNGFKQVVNAMGGVEVCTNTPIEDPDSKLRLPAGTTRVYGERALAFVRARKTLGDGSDISRIKRQQLFLSAAIRQATANDLLLNPVRLYQVIDTASKALTVDEGLNEFSEIRNLAESVRAVKPENITFITMPFLGRNDANVDIDEPAANAIWQAIKRDEPWPPPVSEGPDGKKVTVPPERVLVRVVNANGEEGLARKVSRQLRRLGFQIGEVTDAPKTQKQTVVQYSRQWKAPARTLAYAVGSEMTRNSRVWTETVIIGKDWSGVKSTITVGERETDYQDPRTGPTKASESICAE